jgi:hypothetical protein
LLSAEMRRVRSRARSAGAIRRLTGDPVELGLGDSDELKEVDPTSVTRILTTEEDPSSGPPRQSLTGKMS